VAVARQEEGGDASEADVAVLERLVAVEEPLDDDEAARAIAFNAARSPSIARIARRWRQAAR